MRERDAMNYDPMDEKLEGVSQQAMRMVVKGMPEETVSMTWRSTLNEKLLMEAAAKQKRRRFALILRPALGLGLACTLAVITVFRGHNVAPAYRTSTPDGGIEAALVSVHRQSAQASDVAGVGLSPVEMVAYESSSPQSSQAGSYTPNWSEADLDSL